MKTGKLYIIPSAIAKGTSKKSLTPQLEEVLKSTFFFIAEHARESRRFISSLKLNIKIDDLQFTELNKHSGTNDLENMLNPAFRGNDIGLMSDAGCPGVADPGAAIVNLAHQNGIQVVPMVGPSSILLALMASGLSGQNFKFSGYLPIDQKDLKQKIGSLEAQSRKFNETQIFIETPYRSDKMLNQLVNHLHPETQLTVARDLTGNNEEIITLNVRDWRKYQMVIGKTPCVFLFLAEK